MGRTTIALLLRTAALGLFAAVLAASVGVAFVLAQFWSGVITRTTTPEATTAMYGLFSLLSFSLILRWFAQARQGPLKHRRKDASNPS
jgi:hypothetical protein